MLGYVQVFVGSQVSHRDFPRSTVSVALMTEFGCENGLAVPLAEKLLATGALSVDDVALRLGYAEATSFIAAFKGWTGTTPARYRRSVARPVAGRLNGPTGAQDSQLAGIMDLPTAIG